MFGLGASAQGVHGKVLEVLGVVIVTRGEGVEATSEAIDWQLEIEVIVVGEDDVETPVQLGGGELMEVLGDEGEADEVGLRALGDELAMAQRAWG